MIKEGTKVKVKDPGDGPSPSYTFLKGLAGSEGEVVGPAKFGGFDVRVHFTEEVVNQSGFTEFIEGGITWGFKEEELEVLDGQVE